MNQINFAINVLLNYNTYIEKSSIDKITVSCLVVVITDNILGNDITRNHIHSRVLYLLHLPCIKVINRIVCEYKLRIKLYTFSFY